MLLLDKENDKDEQKRVDRKTLEEIEKDNWASDRWCLQFVIIPSYTFLIVYYFMW